MMTLVIIFCVTLGALMGFLRGESIPGKIGTVEYANWILQETADGRWTLRRWTMLVFAGLLPAGALCFAGGGLPWYAPILLWGLVASAWSLPHSPIVQNSNWMIGVSGLAMTLPPAVALALIGHWVTALICAGAGALKPIVYFVMQRITPTGLAFPFWWSVLAEIINGALEIGVPSALLLVA